MLSTHSQINRRLDILEDRLTREEFGRHNARIRDPNPGLGIEGSEGQEQEENPRERMRGFGDCNSHQGRMNNGFYCGHGGCHYERQIANEPIKGVKVEVPDFLGKLDAHVFKDWLIPVEDYFD